MAHDGQSAKSPRYWVQKLYYFRHPFALRNSFRIRAGRTGQSSAGMRNLGGTAFTISCIMAKYALYVHLQAKPDKRAELAAFLKSALPLAEQEEGTITWYAFQEDDGAYGIFDTFDSEDGRQAHLNGPIAAALMGKASELLSAAPQIHQITLLADKH